ncbi:type ISP restriction/modification enzyme [Burkholderia ubonensis]|uniref:type ISP restriction/modification enzyme n=1 Tax=Burkholderia ubonensis TaxID=101571 RepID=UPI0007C7F08B|nr:type ISP restriction/modification enzyme [Burkholderia ubonensis]
MESALKKFATTLQEKSTVQISGEPEDQLRAPFEVLISDAGSAVAGNAVHAIGETLLADRGGRPDFGVSVGKLLCGYVELKAPGKGADVSTFTGHDRRQWEKFKNLPNILYSDGREFALYRHGERQRLVKLSLDPSKMGAAAVNADAVHEFSALLRDFLTWEPIVPGSSKQLAEYLAPLCRILRDDVLVALRNKAAGVMSVASDWRRYLFPDASNDQFADAYAQTVTFALLLARSNGSDTLFLDEAIESLTHGNTLLSRALAVLTDPLVRHHLSTSLGMLQRVVNAVPTGTMSGGRRDPWLHFYEDFLAEYDPELRKDAGAYYTPVEVVHAQVAIVDDLLRNKMGKRFGWASGGVSVLDPAVGTGTYLLGIIEQTLTRLAEEEGPGVVAARADVLAGSLYGFEVMVGPYAVAALRLTRMLQQYGSQLPGDGVQVMLTNTLESPYEAIPELPLLYQPIGLEHKRAKRVKETVPVLVCIGNPPYDRHAAANEANKALAGGWVRWGEGKNGKNAILEDFIQPVRNAGYGGDLKNLYNLYVYFWRWALWKTFEQDMAHGPGIVTYISASSFIDGNAFLGMRQHMRAQCDEIWVIDLGGEGRGTRRDENVFAIKTPVAITVAVRYAKKSSPAPAKVNYVRIEGTRSEKLQRLQGLKSLADLPFVECSSVWTAPFRPSGTGSYFDWPLLTDLMPWQTSGSQLKRTWPFATTKGVLTTRWEGLMKAENRAEAFKESRDRTIRKPVGSLDGDGLLPTIESLQIDEPVPEVVGYGYRSFDRQFVIKDNRVGDYFRPSLWAAYSQKQVYFTSLLTKILGTGPALTVSAFVPDMDYFSGRGAKDVIPLYRDAEAMHANLHPELQGTLLGALGYPVSAGDFAAYLYGILSCSAFVDEFHDELENRELRVPISLDPDLFKEAVAIGRRLIFLHTFGERFGEGQTWPKPIIKCQKAVPSGRMPESYSYIEERSVISIDGGEFGPVPLAVWNFEVSGLKVVQSWLGYRVKDRKGKKSSPLDAITPKEWGSEITSEFLSLLNLLNATLELHEHQEKLLARIFDCPLMSAAQLSIVPEQWRNAPKIQGKQQAFSLHD